jgi:CelD/BcsL family acetyltransferase involved in cellulose biosynthesis
VEPLVDSETHLSEARCLPDVSDIFEIDPLTDPRWDDFVRGHAKASVFHSLAWLKALTCSYNYEPVVFSTSPPGKPLTGGLLFCRVKSWLTGNRLVSLPFSDHCQPLVDTTEELDAILSMLRQSLLEKQWDYIELRPHAQEAEWQSRISTLHTYAWHTLELEESADTLFRNFQKDCVQRKIRRAEREQLRYETGNSEDLLSTFYRLFVKTRRRHGLPPQPFFWFQQLATAFEGRLQVRLASFNGRPVAGILTLKHGTTITYKYGCSDPSFHNLGGIQLLLWRTIQEAKDEGFRCLDLGRSNVDNEGLIHFKNRWGARNQLIDYLRIPGKPHAKPESWHYSALRAVAKVAPEWCLITAGGLVYQHLG